MENNKYYPPEIEEFHIGFEYQKLIENKWIDAIVTWGKDWDCYTQKFNINDIGNFFKIRVKYLDQSDIESLGFELKGNYSNYCNTYYTDNYSITLYENGEIQINKIGHKALNIIRELFKGTIKNKSELKQVLKMIGININEQ